MACVPRVCTIYTKTNTQSQRCSFHSFDRCHSNYYYYFLVVVQHVNSVPIHKSWFRNRSISRCVREWIMSAERALGRLDETKNRSQSVCLCSRFAYTYSNHYYCGARNKYVAYALKWQIAVAVRRRSMFSSHIGNWVSVGVCSTNCSLTRFVLSFPLHILHVHVHTFMQ